jgi:hypothetical protein
MSEVKEYNGELKDIIIPIPNNAIEMTIKLKVYENGKMFDAEQTFDLEGIKYAENLFEQCCNGEYPVYTLTEKGKEYLENILKEKQYD